MNRNEADALLSRLHDALEDACSTAMAVEREIGIGWSGDTVATLVRSTLDLQSSLIEFQFAEQIPVGRKDAGKWELNCDGVHWLTGEPQHAK